MASFEQLRGICPVPFFQEIKFPEQGGFIAGRFCQPATTPAGNFSCCLPCPITDWVYSDGFVKRAEATNWVNLVALITTVFLLLSFVLLPVKWTHRHYLSICLTLGVMFMELSFVIPAAAKPEQCHNEITPNDMHSNMTCAFSGAFLLFGGWAALTWVFARALTLHLQICWQIVPGLKFFWSAIVLGWGIPAIGVAIALSLTGVSFRFGNMCHINHDKSLPDFWAPLLAFAASALVIQLVTLGYCVHVYLRSLMDDKTTTDASSGLPSYQGSTHTATARQRYRRVKKVLAMQWRGVAIVLLIIFNVVLFSTILLSMDSNLQATSADFSRVEPWVTCLGLTQGDKDQCLPLAEHLVTSEGSILAVLIFLSLTGFWALLFLGRWSMVLGWIDLFKRRFSRGHEFVSTDAHRFSTDPRTYEMLSATPQPTVKTPDAVLRSPESTNSFSPQTRDGPDYFGQEAAYRKPLSSFSTPRPLSPPNGGREWDPSTTYAPRQHVRGSSVSKS